MIYLMITIVILSIWDIKEMKKKKQKNEIYVYLLFMLMVGALGIFYFSNPRRDSFSEILLSLIGK